MGIGQNPIPLVNINIAGKWMFIPLKMVLIGIDPYPYQYRIHFAGKHFATPVNLDSIDDAILGQKTSAGTNGETRETLKAF